MIGVVMLILALAPEVVVTNPAWTRPPDPEQLAQPMPPFAVLIGVDGDVTLDCIAPAEPGPPKACRVVSATVTGLGFEDKARELAATGLLQPRTVDGTPIPSRIRFVARFRAEDAKLSMSRYDGPAPTEAELKLARQLVDRLGSWFEARKSEAFPELEPVRRARVDLWMRQLFPTDRATEAEASATFLARLMTEQELKTAVATGQPPQRSPSIAEFEKAMAGLGDWDEAALATLRNRYCADYDCGGPVASVGGVR